MFQNISLILIFFSFEADYLIDRWEDWFENWRKRIKKKMENSSKTHALHWYTCFVIFWSSCQFWRSMGTQGNRIRKGIRMLDHVFGFKFCDPLAKRFWKQRLEIVTSCEALLLLGIYESFYSFDNFVVLGKEAWRKEWMII